MRALRSLGVTRIELLWATGIAVVLILGFFWFPGGAKGVSDTFGAGAGGKKLFFALTERLLVDVRRQMGRPELPELPASLVMLGPARYPDGAEWKRLHAWVSQGGILVFAARVDDPAVDLGPFGIKVTPRVKREKESDTDREAPQKEAKQHPTDETAAAKSGIEVDPDFASGSFEWKNFGWIEGATSETWIPVRENELPVLIYHDVGEGLLVLTSSDDLFTNATLVKKDNAVLAFHALDAADAGGAVVFDETLNAGGAPKAVGLLFDERLRPLTLQALLCAVVFGWWGSRRFGPPRTVEKTSRRDITEHAVALGNLHYKVGTGSHVVAGYLEFFRRELRLQYGAGPGADVAMVLARRAQVDPSLVRQALGAAERLGKARYAVAAQAAATLRSLARLKAQVDRPHPRRPIRKAMKATKGSREKERSSLDGA